MLHSRKAEVDLPTSKLAPLPAHCSCPCLNGTCVLPASYLSGPLRTHLSCPSHSYPYKQLLGTAFLQGVPPRLSFSQRLPCCGLLLRTGSIVFLFPAPLFRACYSVQVQKWLPSGFFLFTSCKLGLFNTRSHGAGTHSLLSLAKDPFFPSGSPRTHTMKVFTPVLPLFLPMSCYPTPGAIDLCQDFETCLHLRFWARMGLRAL